MMRKFFVTAASLLLAASAFAQTTEAPPKPQEQRVDNRQERQADRIAQGAESGQLTRREQLRLKRQQKKIGHMETKVEADGTVTRKEAVRLEHAQDHAKRRIAHAKHDNQERPAAKP